MSVSPMDAALSTLAAFITSAFPEVAVIQQWPYGNQKLAYPSVTITTSKPKRMPQMPEIISKTDPDSNNQIVANEYVADWDDTFQMDLWCRDKAQRSEYAEKLITLFNSQEIDASGLNKPDGLSLPMVDHFNEICRYEIDSVESVDDEAGAQRQERREKITVLVNCREIRQRTYYAMISIQGQLNVSQTQASADDNSGLDSPDLT